MMRYVIIGNAIASTGAISGIREYDKEGSITVIGEEKYAAYSRPLISYLLLGKTSEENLSYRPESFYEDNNVKVLLGKKATSVDAKERTVTVEGEKDKIPYDKLLIATGSSAFVPPIDGLSDVKNCQGFMTLDDAKGLQKAISEKSRVLIVGAGLIGLKCLEGILDKVKSVDVVDLAPRILPNVLNDEAAAIVQTHIEKSGATFYLGDRVTHFEKGKVAHLASGKTLDFDVLVMAVGVRPRLELLREVGAEINKGVITNSFGQTSVEGVYAAGDVCECADVSSGEQRILALLPNAFIQGETCGMHMAASKALTHPFIPMNATGMLGMHIVTAGNYIGEKYIVQDEKNYKCLFYDDDVLKGYILIGDVARAGIYTALIRERTPLSEIDFDLIADKPQLMAFSKPDRAKKLRGVKA